MKYFVASAFAVILVSLAPLAASAAQVNVSIGDAFFSPKSLNITAGDTVTWTNNGMMPHTVTADNVSFLSGTLQPGKSYSHTFTSVGDFAYYCEFHGGRGGVGMSGDVQVAAAAASVQTNAQAQTTTTSTNTNASTTSNTPLSNVTQLQAQVQVLQQVLAQMHGGSGSSAVPPSSCSAISAPLGSGASGVGVSQLQSFLARDSSVYPQGLVTGFFGALTQAAVQAYQAKNGIISSGTPASTGYGLVGPRTAASIIAQCGVGSGSAGGAAGGTPTVTATRFGGFIQVSPVSGTAPLFVSVQASVNTPNDCGSSLYNLDFGDGTPAQQIQVPAGACSTEQQSYTHTYPSKGAYQIILSAGQHQSTATVVAE